MYPVSYSLLGTRYSLLCAEYFYSLPATRYPLLFRHVRSEDTTDFSQSRTATGLPDRAHASGIHIGVSDDGAPGFREHYGAVRCGQNVRGVEVVKALFP